jgi:hypothetical protein
VPGCASGGVPLGAVPALSWCGEVSPGGKHIIDACYSILGGEWWEAVGGACTAHHAAATATVDAGAAVVPGACSSILGVERRKSVRAAGTPSACASILGGERREDVVAAVARAACDSILASGGERWQW